MKRCESLNYVYDVIPSQVKKALLDAIKTSKGRRIIAIAAAISLSTNIAQAAPTGGQVTSGTGSISQSGDTTNIQQSSQNLSLSWQSFNVAPQETVNFLQPSSSAIAVNRIYDTNGSQILGHLNANGQVYLINPNGILFGQGAQVNVGSLVASTLDINDSSLDSNTRSFSGNGTGSVVNQGTITTASGGYVALLGNNVSNQGTITAPLGTVALGAGNSVTLTFNGDSLLNIQVDQSVLDSLAENGGLIKADGGQVVLTAGARDALLASVVNNTGVIEARTVENNNGTIILLGGMAAGTVNVGGTLDASAPNGGNGGNIETSAASVKIANDAKVTTEAPSGQTGTWLIDPQDFTVAPSGGDISGATLTSSLALSDVMIESSGGSTSGSGDININDTVSWSANTLTLTAANNINLNAVMTASGSALLALNPATANGGDAAVSGGTIQMGMNSSGFTGRIDFSGTGSLSINNIVYTVINSVGVANDTSGSTLQGMKNGLTGHYVLGSNIDASATSSWGFQGFTPVGNMSTKFSGTFDGLGHTISNLYMFQPTPNDVALFGNSSGIVRNVGLSGVTSTGQSYIGALVGENSGAVLNVYASSCGVSALSGHGGGIVGENTGTITNVYYFGGSVGSSGYYIGGIAGYNFGGTMNNTFSGTSVTGSQYIGGLAGGNTGTIENSYASGSTNSGGSYVGGLVGYNSLTITNSYATGSVSGGSNGSYVGGLVGENASTGTLNTVFASGSVSVGSTGTDLGGLVGYNLGTINNAYATGSVGGAGTLGGFAGSNSGTISNAYATGTVSGGSSMGLFLGNNSGTVSNSFWDSQTSLLTTTGIGSGNTAGASGLTTAQMMQLASFSSWNATTPNTISNLGNTGSTWRIYEGHTMPLLTNFMTSLTLTDAPDITVTYNATTQSGGTTATSGVLGSAASGTNAGFYNGYYSDQLGYNIIGGNLTITPAALTVTGTTAANKVYDGTTAATLTGGTLSGVIAGDSVTLNQSGTFATKNVGNNIVVTSTDTLSGSSAGNYTLTQPTGLTASITPAAVTVTGTTAANKVYDGTTAATLTGGTLVGTVAGDSVTLIQSGTFASKNVGTGIAVTANDRLGGASAGNYTLTQPTGLSANITPASLTVTANNAYKLYDGSAYSGGNGVTYSGFGVGDTSAVLSGTLAYSGTSQGAANIGNYVITPSGLSGSNYTISYADGTLFIMPIQTFNPIITQLESSDLPSQAGTQPGALEQSTTLQVTEDSDLDKHIASNYGTNGPVLRIVRGGVNLPLHAVAYVTHTH